MNPKNNAKLNIEVSWPQEIVGHVYHPEIRVIDEASNQTVVVVELSENDWLRLAHGTHISNLDGWIVPEHLRGRLGKRFEHTSIPVPKELHWSHRPVVGEGPVTRPGDDMTEWAMLKVEELNSTLQVYLHWTDWKLYHGQGGWELQVRRWVPIPDAEAVKVEA